MPIIFTSDFENTVSPFGWDGISRGTGCVVTVNTDHPHHGAYNLFCTVPAGSTFRFANLRKQVTGTGHDHFFARAMNVMLDYAPPNGDYFRPFAFYQDPSSNAICFFCVKNVGGTLYWCIRYRHAGVFTDLIGLPFSLNTLYCVEVEILQSTEGQSDGLARIWANGVLVAEILNIDNDDRIINNVEFGLVNSSANATNDTHMWADCFALSTERIGCEGAVLPRLTITSNPELGVPVYVDNQFIGNTPIVVELPSGTHTVRVEAEVTR